MEELDSDGDTESEHDEPANRPKPGQEKTIQMINMYEKEVKHLRDVRDSGLLKENFEK